LCEKQALNTDFRGLISVWKKPRDIEDEWVRVG